MIGLRIAYLRKLNNMTQSQMAKALNISPSSAGMYEQGRRVPDIQTLANIARLFGVTLDYLITGTEFVPSPRRRHKQQD